MSDPNDYRHIFATILPPSVEDKPICGADLARDWHGRGKPDCPACEAKRTELLARVEQQAAARKTTVTMTCQRCGKQKEMARDLAARTSHAEYYCSYTCMATARPDLAS